LHALGLTKREAVLTCYLICGTCGMVGVYLTQARLGEAYLVAGIVTAVAVAAIIWLERVCPGGQADRR
jgi:UDP-GlcNAc:undecaprenyl-phosphate GlcNAc-1-phosphate transferase